MNFDDPKFRQPTAALGDWHVERTALFESEAGPSATKFAIEKMTAQLLFREPIDAAHPRLRYSSTSSAGGFPLTLQLELRAASGTAHLYALTCTGSAPKRWENEVEFTRACDRRFTFWCAKLRLVPDANAWGPVMPVQMHELIAATQAQEDAEAARTPDPAPIAYVQQHVLDGLKAGQVFITAHKEGGTRLYFDGTVYRRSDYGDGLNRDEVYADGPAMLKCLRRFYDWEAQRDVYPHQKDELQVWRYILGQLRKR